MMRLAVAALALTAVLALTGTGVGAGVWIGCALYIIGLYIFAHGSDHHAKQLTKNRRDLLRGSRRDVRGD